ncbi:MAG: hypothetical protein R2878_06475 [Thermoleophilia bacterium]
MRRHVALIALAGLAAASPAAAQTFTYSLTPPYQEGVNGANGWYRQNVTANYVCTPPPLGLVLVCGTASGTEVFRNGAGATGAITRTATFSAPIVIPPLPVEPAPAPITLPINNILGAPLRIDTVAPPTPTITVPQAGAVYDAGSVATVRFGCTFGGDLSGPAPGAARCVGTQPNGARLDTGTADVPGTWGNKVFTVTAMDAAGNTSVRTVQYRVDEIPGAPVLSSPADGDQADARPVFVWNPPADDGSGLDRWRLRITPSSGDPRTYTFQNTGNPVSFQPPTDLPDGNTTWNVTFIDSRNVSATSTTRRLVIRQSLPGAPTITQSPTPSTNAQPSFAWAPAEAGGTFTWEVAGANGAVVDGPAVTAATSAVVGPLAAGTYAFRVRQTSSLGRAGGWSAPAPFTINSATTSQLPPTPTTPIGTPKKRAPRIEHAKRMRPRAGVKLTSRRPVLRWTRNPHARLYNLQIFRVTSRKYIKVRTAFPRTNKYRLPKRRALAPGRRYVWRVWPYVASKSKYTRQPLGISWFDVRKPAAKAKK